MTAVAAVLLLLAAAGADPAAAVRLSEQALEAAQGRDFAAAERLWKQALAANPKYFDANFNLGYMYQSQGAFEAAAPFLEAAAASEPKNFNAQYLLGVVLSRLGRTDAALARWRAALALHPDDLRLMQILAVEYSKGRYFRDAAEVAEKALGRRREDPSLWLTAIKARQDADEHAAALGLAQKMAAAFPENARAAFELGYELTRAGRLEEGLPWLKKAMSGAQPWEEPFYFYGDVLLKSGSAREAAGAFRRALELRRDYMPAWAGLGRALLASGDAEGAREALLEAAKVDPTHPQPHLLLAQVYFRLGQEEAAAREKELAARLRRGRPEALESVPGRVFGAGAPRAH